MTIEMLKSERSDLNLAVGSEQYFTSLMGYPIKKSLSDNHKRLKIM